MTTSNAAHERAAWNAQAAEIADLKERLANCQKAVRELTETRLRELEDSRSKRVLEEREECAMTAEVMTKEARKAAQPYVEEERRACIDTLEKLAHIMLKESKRQGNEKDRMVMLERSVSYMIAASVLNQRNKGFA